MLIGILKEIKAEENRVSMTPAGVEVLVKSGHRVLVEHSAGVGSEFSDAQYEQAGAEMVSGLAAIYAQAEMIMHVKEPQPSEYPLIRQDQIIFTYLHLAAEEELTKALMTAGSVNIAYETIQKNDRSLPLLTPMSEVAGRMAAQEGANYLQMSKGGRGILLGGVPGVEPGNVVVIGCGVVGLNAARIASGLGARVYMLDIDLDRLRYLSEIMPGNCYTVMSSRPKLRQLLQEALAELGPSAAGASATYAGYLVEADPRDRQTLEAILAETGWGLHLSYPLHCWGGVIARTADHRIVAINTLENRLEHAMPSLRRHLAACLESS